MIQIICKAS